MASSSAANANVYKLQQAGKLLQSGQAGHAKQTLQQVIAKSPGDLRALLLLRQALSRLGEFPQAVYYAERAAKLAPSDPGVLNNLGIALVEAGRYNDAAEVLARAVALAPDVVMNHAALANALGRGERFVEAERVAREGLKLQPGHPQLAAALRSCLLHMGQANEALALAKQAVSEHGTDNLHTLSFLCGLHNYASATTPGDTLASAHLYARTLARLAPLPPGEVGHENSREPERRLRVALLGGDYRSHASVHFSEPLIEHLDRERFELFVYHNSVREDEVSARLKGYPGVRWLNVSRLRPGEHAKRIREDRVDIAIDQAGHTVGNCLIALHLRPAPVQASWMGYVATTGMSSITHKIVSTSTDPASRDRFASEKMWRIDPCFFAYRPPAPLSTLPEVGPAPFESAGAVTFGCFSSMPKISDELIRQWSRIMRGVPGSRLLLKNNSLTTQAMRDWFRHRLQINGIPGDRLLVEEPAKGSLDMLGHYQRVDIALDTHPYAAMTTACEAILMGVPLVTHAGVMPGSRGAVPALQAVGLDDLIATDEEGYIDTAIRLGRDQDRQRSLRVELRAKLAGSYLMDERGWCRRFETALRQMWREWCAETPGSSATT